MGENVYTVGEVNVLSLQPRFPFRSRQFVSRMAHIHIFILLELLPPPFPLYVYLNRAMYIRGIPLELTYRSSLPALYTNISTI